MVRGWCANLRNKWKPFAHHGCPFVILPVSAFYMSWCWQSFSTAAEAVTHYDFVLHTNEGDRYHS